MMFEFMNGSRRNDEKSVERFARCTFYGATSSDNKDSITSHCYSDEDTDSVSDGSNSQPSSESGEGEYLGPVSNVEETSSDDVTSNISHQSWDADVESQRFIHFRDDFKGCEESSPLIKSVGDLENARKFTDSETTSLTAITDSSTSSVQEDAAFKEDYSGKLCSIQGCGRGFYVPGWKAYNRSLDHNPVATKAITSFFGWFLGDFITQTMLTKNHPFDLRRSATMSSFGLFFHGPVGHIVYDHLDRIIMGTGPRQVVAKICVDQLLWCPIFMICYFTYLGVLNGDSLAINMAKLKVDLLTAVAASWKIWPLAHAIQFRWVATKHRIIYINCIEVCFIMFLSFLANQ